MKLTLKASPLVTLQSVSQYAHVGWGYIFVTAPTLLIGQRAMWWAAALTLVASAGKEYWDFHGLEDDATSGGLRGSLEDFGFWCVGNALAVILLLLRR
jgi:hypothetical protein